MSKSMRVKTVESALGIKVPADYARFLDKYGIYQEDGEEVYGLDDSITDTDQIPCVIGATKMWRINDGLDHKFLLVAHSGYEDEVICLNNEDGAVYRWAQGKAKKIAGSFSEWFKTEVLSES